MDVAGKASKHKWVLTVLAVMCVAIWAETFVSSKVLLSHGLMPADIFVYRFAMAYLCMVALSHNRLHASSWRDEVLLVLMGITGGSLYFLTENMALKFSTASNVSILVGTTPLMTALLLSIFYREERMSRMQVAGSLIAFAGLVLVVLNGQFILHLNPVGDTLALTASLTWAFYSLMMKVLGKRYDARFVTRKVFGYGLLTIVPWFILVEPLQVSGAILSQPIVWGNLLWLGLVASMGCYLVWNWILPKVGVVKSTNIIYTQSTFTMIISTVVLGERITLMAIAGVAILVGGMMLINKTRLTNKKHKTTIH